jgi:hypothetical protein
MLEAVGQKRRNVAQTNPDALVSIIALRRFCVVRRPEEV